MASDRACLEAILEQFSAPGEISFRPMMGEFLLYCRGRLFGGIYDNRLLIKATPAARALLPEAETAEPYPGAKEMLLAETVDDPALLQALARAACGEPKK